jgi:hypothetical protein
VEVLTEVPQSGTTLKIDNDRSFDGPSPGDSVLRVMGQSKDGTQVFDAAYVEVDPQEAETIALLLRQLRKPGADLTDEISQEVLAAFGSKVSGRDAHQISEICNRAWWQSLKTSFGPHGESPQRIEQLAEKFERAAAKRRNAPSFTGGNGETPVPASAR